MSVNNNLFNIRNFEIDITYEITDLKCLNLGISHLLYNIE